MRRAIVGHTEGLPSSVSNRNQDQSEENLGNSVRVVNLIYFRAESSHPLN